MNRRVRARADYTVDAEVPLIKRYLPCLVLLISTSCIQIPPIETDLTATDALSDRGQEPGDLPEVPDVEPSDAADPGDTVDDVPRDLVFDVDIGSDAWNDVDTVTDQGPDNPDPWEAFVADRIETIDSPELPDPGEVADASSEEVTLECPGNPGCPCESHDECFSGFCAETMYGWVCSETCETVDECPKGWECTVCIPGPSPVVCCLPPSSILCRPCIENSDCKPPFGNESKEYLCVEFGPQGRFCGVECGQAEDCPAGFECAQPGGGDTPWQCLPEGGADCPCTDKYVGDGALTVCFEENIFGKCEAQVTCDQQCGAKVPGPEGCTGVDDDCDGQTDEEDAAGCFIYFLDVDGDKYGTDEGGKCLCSPTGNYSATVGGDCDDGDSAVHPGMTEECNGKDDNCDSVTDEGFPDTNDNGVADCVDDDCDGDGTPNESDNCFCTWNPGQEDNDLDTMGDECDDDDDNDGVVDVDDNCQFVSNSGQANHDDDAAGDECDEDDDNDLDPDDADCAPLDADVNHTAVETCNGKDDDCDEAVDPEGSAGCQLYLHDGDEDGYGVTEDPRCLCAAEAPHTALEGGDCDDEASDVHPGVADQCDGKDNDCNGFTDDGFPDLDGDKFADCVDPDIDGDWILNELDNCPMVANEGQEDCGGDGVGDACDEDDDADGVLDTDDNCRCVDNPGQEDEDLDDEGDACDCDQDDDGVANANPGCPEPEPADNCPMLHNPDQTDLNKNGVGDACDFDLDGDDVPNVEDNCPNVPNADQADFDKDSVGDVCDPDDDGDGVEDTVDNCPKTSNPNQKDYDLDGTGDACDPDRDGDGVLNDADNCVGTPNPGQEDADDNGIGDACDDDWDGDGILNGEDNCPSVPNPGQGDIDENGEGDVCDCDADGDGAGNVNPGCPAPDPEDNCTHEPNVGQEDLDGDGLGDVCDPDRDGDLDPDVTDCAPDDASVFNGQFESCNSKDDDCDGATDEVGASGCSPLYYDGDSDGFGVSDKKCLCGPDGLYSASIKGDCNDAESTVNPGAAEACNLKDDDCDGATDEEGAGDCTVYYSDGDDDGYGIEELARCLCAPEAPYNAIQAGDCSDADQDVFPGAAESCNGKDDDCDGDTDEVGAGGCSEFFLDVDRDDYGVTGDTQCLCVALEPYDADKSGDCDDGNVAVNPGASESCNGADDNCDGQTDEEGAVGCHEHFRDDDQDTWGQTDKVKCLCVASAPFTANKGGDCDDGDAAVNPGADESCNSKDDDCDGGTDGEGSTGCYDFLLDADQDSYGVDGDAKCLCAAASPYTAAAGGDCDDSKNGVNPGSSETCNGIDDDCDSDTDEEDAIQCATWYLDHDADTYGGSSDTKCLCGPSGEYTADVAGDCDDSKAAINPGASENCNGVDDDCDSDTDEEDALGCQVFYFDDDSDTYGVDQNSRCLCTADGKHSAAVSGDCDDGDGDVNPGALEACNGKDDDCGGDTDEEDADGCVVYYLDADVDTWGVDGDTKCLCAASGQYTASGGGDCDDGASGVHPTAVEVCANSVDEDCDGSTDEEGCQGCVDYYLDADGDTWGVDGDVQCLSAPSGDYRATRGGDCADGDAAVNPGATEACDGKDDDCDGQTDEQDATGCATLYLDSDEDAWGKTSDSKCLCGPLGQYTATNGGDCDDASSAVNPDATESCNGGVDDDCDGKTDEEGADGCGTFYLDFDVDTYGKDGDTKCLCAASGKYTGSIGGDCNDNDASINPGTAEVCNGKDDDCDQQTDEAGTGDCTTYYLDADSDTWGVTGSTQCTCGPEGYFTAVRGGDCADQDDAVHPNAAEACNGKDDDCEGGTDEEGAQGCSSHFLDADSDSYGLTAYVKCLCGPEGQYSAITGGDCADGDQYVNPGATEACNFKDDDCDGDTDEQDAEGCSNWYYDFDGDAWGTADSRCQCASVGKYAATQSGDCNDNDGAVNPGATETCNGKDDNCAAGTDEAGATGCAVRFRDDDQDGYGVDGDSLCTCSSAYPYTAAAGGDCADADGAVNPDAPEKCNGKDDDCDALTDGADGDLTTDDSRACEKQDGVCWGLAKPASLCSGGAWQACTDTEYSGYSTDFEADEAACDGKDNDCDGTVDDGHPDNDQDDEADCVDPDDDDDGIMDDGGQNGVDGDEPCADQVTEGCDDNCPFEANPFQEDNDGDGQGDACDPDDDNDNDPDETDCEDFNPAVNANAPEVCNGVDDDCDGATDSADADLLADDPQACAKQAGVCGGSNKPASLCANAAWGACTATEYEAHDADYEEEPETLCDGKDNDCDGNADETFPNKDGDGLADCVDPDDDDDGVLDDGDGSGTVGDGKCAGGATTVCDDNCRLVANPDQADLDGNGVGDVCDEDVDGDGIPDDTDNCPLLHNDGQENLDVDDYGDACDCDIDGDGVGNAGTDHLGADCPVSNPADNCPTASNVGQEDLDLNGVGDVCDPDIDGDGDPNGTDCDDYDASMFSGAPEVCNGKDDDCDGLTDSSDAELTVDDPRDCEKQDGVCAGSAKPATLCVTGVWQACTDTEYGSYSGDYLSPEVLCDGKDNDCDGVTDGGFPDTDGDGLQNCVDPDDDNDGISDDGGGNGTAGDEPCTGGATTGCDDNCRLVVNADQANFDADGQGDACDDDDDNDGDDDVTDCARFDADIGHGIPEKCNGVDDDCEDGADEDWPLKGQSCTVGLGECAADGTWICMADGSDIECDAVPGMVATEVCDSKDNDCDGLTDAADPEDLVAGDPQNCANQTGICAGSTKPAYLCSGGVWGDCTGPDYTAHDGSYEGGQETTCTGGQDNDCDGTIDCADPDCFGQSGCMAEGLCGDLLDNDADGCTDAADVDCGGVETACDDTDEDCDGNTDEDWPNKGTSCTVGVGECERTGTRICNTGGTDTECSVTPGASTDETCDGMDNDCDGSTDEVADLGQTTCGLGECEHTVDNCVGGTPQTCDPMEGATAESCDGTDNDCDGSTDEFADLGQTTCGLGECEHTVDNCAGGTPQTCDPMEGATAETCSGKDDDCDGLTDADDGDLLSNDPQSCEKQDGVCAGSSKPADLCAGGEWQACSDTQYGAHDAAYANDEVGAGLCDGKDNDCDGSTDEGYDNHDPDSMADCVDPDDDNDGILDDGGGNGTDGDQPCTGGDTTACDDNCPFTSNPDQADLNTNGVGDDCEDDWDGDGVLNATDNCAWVANADQADLDTDEVGDACDCDIDGDGVDNANTGCPAPDPADNCTTMSNPGQENYDIDGQGDACDDDDDNDNDPDTSDCEQFDPAVSHNAAENCGNGVEDDCDGVSDCSDDDCFGQIGCTAEVLCGDSLDNDADGCTDGVDINCGGAEGACGNAADDDCDGTSDCGDADCFGQAGCTSEVLCSDLLDNDADGCTDGGDADCGGGETSCNGADDDCDGATDEDYSDKGDACSAGIGECKASGTRVCKGDGSGTECSAVAGAPTDEVCDAKDNDCDGNTDAADPTDLVAHDPQACANQTGVCGGSTKPAALCSGGTWGDCGSEEYTVHSGDYQDGQETTCGDGKDNDCDAAVDCSDSDCFGQAGCTVETLCGDSLDNDADGCTDSVDKNCGGEEAACNGADDDCDGNTDAADGAELLANDGQDCENQTGVCNGSTKPASLCTGGTWDPCNASAYSGHSGDYEDGVEASCADLKDNDCDAAADCSDADCFGQEGCTVEAFCGDALDNDADGCTDGVDGDCGGTETDCGNGVDDDCDGSTDCNDADCSADGTTTGGNGCSEFWFDFDGDTYGTGNSRCTCAADVSGNWDATRGGDCEDDQAGINPGVTETCNGINDDCDAQTDEGNPCTAGETCILANCRECYDGNVVSWDGCTADEITEFQVNTFATGAQYYPRAVGFDDGRYVVVWHSEGVDGDSYGIAGQRFLPDGSPYGSEFVVNQYTTSSQAYARVAAFPDGRGVVVWQSSGGDGDGNAVFGRIYHVDQGPVSDDFALNTYTTGNQTVPDVTVLADGSFVTAWVDDNEFDGQYLDIRARRFHGNHLPEGDEFRVNVQANSGQYDPDIEALGGGYIAAWGSWYEDGDGSGIFVRRFDADGTPLTGDVQVNTWTTGHQEHPSVTVHADGSYVVVWDGLDEDETYKHIQAQRFQADHSPAGVNFQVNAWTASPQWFPRVAKLPGAGFAVVWWDSCYWATGDCTEQDGSDDGLVARFFNSAGTPLGDEFVAHSYTTGFQQHPWIASLADGRVVMTWDGDQPGGNRDVMSRIYNADGSPYRALDPDQDVWMNAADGDDDGDGYADGNSLECDPLDALIPSASETCNGKDDNCEGSTDEGVGSDTDGDGIKDCVDWDDDGDDDPDLTDCAPLVATVYFGAAEVCGNSVDDDCDGVSDCTDPDCYGLTGCTAESLCSDSLDNDADGCTDGTDADCGGSEGDCSNSVDDDCDGYSDCGDTDCLGLGGCTVEALCADSLDNDADGCTDGVDADCGGSETLCDNLDNDCDGATDEGCDDDGDGFCDASMTTVGTPSVCPEGGGDNCDAPGAVGENNHTASGCANCADNDSDGWYDQCDVYLTLDGDDCDDGDPNNWTTAGCNICLDDDGDGWYEDCDAYVTISGPDACDDKKNAWSSSSACSGCFDGDADTWWTAACDGYLQGSGPDQCDSNTNAWTTAGCANCKDADSDNWWVNCDAYTGVSGEDCDDTVPQCTNDCTTDADADSVKDCRDRCLDADGDEYGTTQACTGAGCGDAACSGTDCNDGDTAIYQGNPEVCDGKDNDCEGGTDEDYTDKGDACTGGLGECETAGTMVCKGDGTGTECNAVPGTATTETCNGLDDDCDGTADNGLTPPSCTNQTGVCAGSDKTCGGASGWLDCNAASYGVDYEAPEGTCNDGKDNDCDGQADCADANCFAQTGCTAEALCADGKDNDDDGCTDDVDADCGGSETLCDNLDNDCDGATDEGCDDDGDRFCDASMTTVGTPSVCPEGGGDNCDAPGAVGENNWTASGCANCADGDGDGWYDLCDTYGTIAGDDCDDLDPKVWTTAGCNNCRDDDSDNWWVNCDAYTDVSGEDCDDTVPQCTDDCTTDADADSVKDCRDRCLDADGDEYGTTQACTGAGCGDAACSGTDCNDGDTAIYQGNPEVCDGKDNDCDNSTDEDSGLCTLPQMCLAGACRECYDGNAVDWDGCNAGDAVEFQVNEYTTGWQYNPAAATFGDGTFVLAWTSQNQDGSGFGVFANLYAPDGSPVGSEFQVNTFTTSHQQNPSVSTFTDGRFVVAWESYSHQDGSWYGVFGQRYLPDGTPDGSEFQVNTYTTDWQYSAKVAPFTDGRFVVAWASDLQDGDGYGVYAQMYRADGVKDGGEFRVNTVATGLQQRPTIAVHSDDTFVVAWEGLDHDFGTATQAAYAQRYATDGTPLGNEFVLNQYSGFYSAALSAIALTDGRFTVAWSSAGDQDGSANAVVARTFAADGTASTGSFVVNSHTTGNQFYPSAAPLPGAKMLITWWGEDDQDGDGRGVFGQRFLSTGDPPGADGAEFQVNEYTTGEQLYPAAASWDDGRFVVAWYSDGQDGDGHGVYARLFGADGSAGLSLDGDGDGLMNPADDDDDGDGTVDGSDCEPLYADSYPGATEVCDGRDNDCNGSTDEGFTDTDGDGIADCVDWDDDGDGWPGIGDCDDTESTVYPGATEVCDGKDNDCNGLTDDGCTCPVGFFPVHHAWPGLSNAVFYGTVTGGYPQGVTIGDLDGDWDGDLVVANSYKLSVSVLLGNGDGTFQAAVNYGVGNRPLSTVVSYLDGDQDVDLAVSNRYSDTVSVLLGNGDGTFQTAVGYGTGSEPMNLQGRDLDGDGDVDIVTANRIGDSASVLLGNGDGTFQAAVDYGAGNGPRTVAVGDLDDDSNVDLAVANLDGNSVSVLLGNGDGTFQTAVDHGIDNGPRTVVIEDLDGDGEEDLAVSNLNGGTVSVLLGNGDGTFQAAATYGTAAHPAGMVAIDLDSDGIPDLATANFTSNNVSVLLGNGDGTFQAAVNHGTFNRCDYLAAGDLDGNGSPDLAVSSYNDHEVGVMLNQGPQFWSCTACEANCDECTDETTCTACAAGWHVVSGDCVAD